MICGAGYGLAGERVGGTSVTGWGDDVDDTGAAGVDGTDADRARISGGVGVDGGNADGGAASTMDAGSKNQQGIDWRQR